MSSAAPDRLRPGRNIAIKVPPHPWDATLAFYRDRAGLEVSRESPDSVAFAFGPMMSWLDRVPHQSRGSVWLELFADDPDAGLERMRSPRRDELEPLDGVTGHWASDPAGSVLLVRRPEERDGPDA